MLAQLARRADGKNISTDLWTGTGSDKVPNYIMGKAKANFNDASLDVLSLVNENGTIKIDA